MADHANEKISVKIKRILLEPMEMAHYEGDYPESRLLQADIKTRWMDMLWAIHGKSLLRNPRHISAYSDCGFFDNATGRIFRACINMIQWGPDTLKAKYSDARTTFDKIDLTVSKLLAIPALLLGCVGHAIGIPLRMLVTVLIATIATVTGIFLLTHIYYTQKCKRLAKKAVEAFDNKYEGVQSHGKKHDQSYVTLKRLLAQRHLGLEECHTEVVEKKSTIPRAKLTVRSVELKDQAQRVIASYKPSVATNFLVSSLFEVSRSQREQARSQVVDYFKDRKERKRKREESGQESVNASLARHHYVGSHKQETAKQYYIHKYSNR